MRRFMACWLHTDPGEPLVLYTEVGEDGFETRKVEVYADGSCGYASAADEAGGTRLATVEVPALEVIRSDPAFESVGISGVVFEEVWASRLEQRVRSGQRLIV